MSSKSSYIAEVVLRDEMTYTKDWYKKGPADEVLIEALRYLSKKDSNKNIYKRILDYIIDDFKEFDRHMTKLFFGRDKDG